MYTIPSIDERVDFYIAPSLNRDSITHEKLPSLEWESFFIDCRFCWGNYAHKTQYLYPARSRFSELGLTEGVFPITIGDVCDNGDIYSFSKSRLHDTNLPERYTLLRCFDEKRHWGVSGNNLYSVNQSTDAGNDILRYSDKKPFAVWRGVSSGLAYGWDYRRGSRFKLVEEYSSFEGHKINVKFSSIAQNNEYYEDNYPISVLSIPDQLSYKYVISCEGNDKDSGLQWKLKSNSLVFMAEPTISSWLMEKTLIPNYHYIKLEDNFEDLEEKIDWCESHYDECIKIITNAHSFMSQFQDIEREKEIERRTIEKHLSLVEYYK